MNRKEAFKLSPVKPPYFVPLCFLVCLQPGIVNRQMACHHTVHNPWLTAATCRGSACCPGMCSQECCCISQRHSLPLSGFVNTPLGGGSRFGLQRVQVCSLGTQSETPNCVGGCSLWNRTQFGQLSGLWTDPQLPQYADNRFQVGSWACKLTNLKPIQSQSVHMHNLTNVSLHDGKEQGRTTATKKKQSETYPRKKTARGK